MGRLNSWAKGLKASPHKEENGSMTYTNVKNWLAEDGPKLLDV